VLFLDPTRISESYRTGQTLFCRTLEYLTLGEHKHKHKQIKQLSATIASRDTSINTTINASMQSTMEEVKHELTTQLESVFASLCTKLKIPTNDSFPDAHTKTEGETSSQSHTFQPHHFQRDIHLPRVDVTKFDGSDPTSWLTQMEHYFSLYNITDDLVKLWYGVLHLYQEHWQWW
jgi:hypothetical protein